MSVSLEPLTRDDADLRVLQSIHREPSVAAFVSVAENYFAYVTETPGVRYEKIMLGGVPIGGIHSETDGDKVYFSICVTTAEQRKGYATTAMRQFLTSLPESVRTVEGFVEPENAASRHLLQKCGFAESEPEDGLIPYRLCRGASHE